VAPVVTVGLAASFVAVVATGVPMKLAGFV